MSRIHSILSCSTLIFIWFVATFISIFFPIFILLVISRGTSPTTSHMVGLASQKLIFIIFLGFVSFYMIIKPKSINFLKYCRITKDVMKDKKLNEKISYIISITLIVINLLIAIMIY